MNINQLTHIVVKTAEILLSSGAEIYRVEDTISRICRSYKVSCETFVVPSCIFISIGESEQEAISLLKRVKDRSVDLHRIELINNFSRSLGKNPLDYEEGIEELQKIEKTKGYSFGTRLAVAGLTAFIYVMLFQGKPLDGAIAMAISLLIYTFKEKVQSFEFFQFFQYFISGIIAGGLSILAHRFLPQLDIYKTIIGAIMILLPGVAISNGIKDALYGDITSSLFRLWEAIFIATALGAGVGIMLSFGL